MTENNHKIAITGATGLVGSHLLVKLATENKIVVALFRTEKSKGNVIQLFNHYKKKDFYKNIEWVKADVLDLESLKKAFKNVKEVYHTAALVSFEKKDSQKLEQINVGGTQHVLDAMLFNHIDKIMLVSSVASIRNTDKNGFFSENGTIEGNRGWNAYSKSKYDAENLVLSYSSKGIKSVIINPGVILGPGEITKSSTAIFNTIKEGLKFYTEGINGFVDVRDVVDALVGLSKKEKTEERYVCVGENIKFKAIFEMIANELKVRPPKYKANKLMLALAWRVEYVTAKIAGRTPKITRDNTQAALEIMKYDSSQLKKDLDFEFRTLQSACKNASVFFDNK